MAATGTHSPCAAPLARSRNAPRRAAVLILVHVLLLAHIAQWWFTGRTLGPFEPSEAMEFSKHSVINVGLVVLLGGAAATALFGRFFCGWGCHVIALQDLCRALLLRVGIRPRPLRSRALAIVPVLAFAYMFLLPLLVRWHAGDALEPSGTSWTTDRFWSAFPSWGVALVTVLVCGFATVYLLGSKGFCTYACPYGALFGLADRLAPARIRVTDACERCGHCTRTCSSNVDVAREVATHGMVVDPGCMKTLDCVSACPTGALYYGLGRPALGVRRRRRAALSVREELALAGLFLATFLALRGLYGLVPFLLALGLAACAAGAGLVALRLRRRVDAGLPGLPLARDGRLLPAARVYAAVALGGALLVVHSGLVQLEGWRSARSFAAVEPLRASWFTDRRSALDPEQVAQARAVLAHGGRALALGLLSDRRRHSEVAWAGLVLGEEETFERHLARAIAASRNPAIPHLELGNHHRERGELERTLEHYRAALTADPTLEFAWPMFADVLRELDREQELLPALADAVERTPRRPALRALYAAELQGRGDLRAAGEQLRRALGDAPRDLTLRSRLADVPAARGERDACVSLMEEGVALAPGDPAALRVLAVTHLVLGEPGAAQEACRAAISLGDPQGEGARLMERIRRELAAQPDR